jgi:hypothetical protein
MATLEGLGDAAAGGLGLAVGGADESGANAATEPPSGRRTAAITAATADLLECRLFIGF